MSAIFISYRRDDAPDAAGRIYDRLRSRFGEKSVFFDIDAIPYGVDYRHHIDTVVASCDVLLVIIGNHWQQTGEDGRRRLDDPGDFVRIEVESALERGIPVIPVLVERASVPLKSDLPDVLKDFAFRNAAEVRTGSSFQGQIDRLIDDIAERVEGAGSDKAASASVDAGDKDPTSSSAETTEADSSRLVEEPEKIAPAEIESTISSIDGAKVISIALGAIDYWLIGAFTAVATLYNLEFTWTSYLGYLMLVLAGWGAMTQGGRTYLLLAVAFVASILVSVGIALLDYEIAIDPSTFLQSLVITWGVVELAARRKSLPSFAGQPIVLAIVGFLLGLSFDGNFDFGGSSELSASFSLTSALPFLCLVIGLSGRLVPIIFAFVILTTLTGVSEAFEFRGGNPYLLEGDLEIYWRYSFRSCGEFLILLFLGWALFARLSGNNPNLNWLTSPAGMGGFTILGLLHTNAQIGNFEIGFYGSAILSLTAIFACGWLYSRKAQVIGIVIAIAFLAFEYWDSIYEVAFAQEEETAEVEVVIVTQVSRRAGLTLFEVLLLPVVAYLGEVFRRIWEWSVATEPNPPVTN